jgi:CheY-like chemotaxis protein
MECLGAQYVVATDIERLRAVITGGDYDYVFAPKEASSVINELLSQVKSDIKPVSIVNYGQKGGKGRGARVVYKPLYCLPIARVLNEADEIKSPAREKKDQIRFIAPEAKVLVVDDILINLKVAKGFLSIFNIKVDTASSGQQAIDLVKTNNYDIIFMDHMMPGMDGIETTGYIRKLPEGQNVPIIALTANAITGVKEMFISNGLNDFISKPIERGKLETMLTEWLPKEKIKAASEAPAA